MSLDIQQVESLNRKAQTLNSDRQQKIGMQQAAKQAYERAVYAYEQKYGVKLDDTNLQQEYNSVRSDLETAFTELNTLVTSIENGEHTAQPTPSVVQSNAPLQQAPTPQAQPQTGAFGAPTQPQQFNSMGAQTGRMQTATPNASAVPSEEEPSQYRAVSPELLAQASMGAMNQQVPTIDSTPPIGTPTPIPTPTPISVPTQGQATSPSEQAFTPAGWGSPTPDINQQFANINNGKPFGQ